MAVIEVQDLHFSYPSWAQHPLPPTDDPSPVLRGVDLCVERGEFLAVMGPTGAGKSTLCMALNGLVPQATGGVIRGRVEVLGHEARRTPVAQMATHVGLVTQDPDTQLISATVEEEVAFGPGNLGLDRRELVERVEWALGVVGMSAHRQRSPTQLSGGQKQRVAIAAALAMLPQVLILDEPTAMLDPVGQSEVFAVVERLCCERGMTLLMVTQDAERVAQFADRLAILHDGRIICHDEPLRVFEDTCREGAGHLLRCPAPGLATGVATPQVVELAVALNEAYGTSFHLPHLDEAEATLRPWLTHLPLPKAPSRRSPSEVGNKTKCPPGDLREGEGNVAIRFDGVRFYYGDADAGAGSFEALNGVTLDVADGAYLAVVGQNGSGKTTLVKQINGLLKPTSGKVTVYGVDTRTATVGRLAHTVGYAFQNPDHQIFCATTREEIAFGPRNLGLSADEVRARTDETLAAFGLTALADAPPAVLGHGLRRKVAVASVVAMRPRVLILDEPTAGLDRRSADELMALVDQLHEDGHTILVVTHDMQLVAKHCPETLVMHEGLVLDYGPTRQVFQHEAVLAQAQLLAPQITRLAGRLTDLGIPSDILSVDEFCAAVSSQRSPGEVGDKASDPCEDLREGSLGRGRA